MVATVVQSGLGQDSSETSPQDPWANIFPPTLLRPGNLPLEASHDIFGMYDAEDQVYRCLDCMHEIWGGLCSRCSRHYSGYDFDASDENVSEEEHRTRSMEHVMGWPRGASEDESDDGEGSYECSFIDDEYSEGSEDGDETISDNSISDRSQKEPRRPILGTRRQVLSESDVDDDSGHSTNSEDDGSLARPPMRLFGRQTMPLNEGVESEFSESDDGNNVGLQDGHSSDDRWSGVEQGAAFSAGIMVEEESSDVDDVW